MASNGLFDTLRIGPLRLRNRFIKSATNEGMTPGGLPTRALLEHHRAMAAGGVGMTTVAYCAVLPDGRTFVDQAIMDAATVPQFRALTEAVHRENAAACAQLTHGGAFTFLPQLSTRYPFSASGGFNAAGALSGRLFRTAMREDDMKAVREAFVAAALQAEAAGFDAVELHMGHGYLLSQFLSPLYNRRKDGWGGTAARRARFPAEVLSAVLDAVGARLAVSCKLSVTEGTKRGGQPSDAAEIARVLESAGAHLLVLSGGMNVESPWAIFGNPLPASAVETIQNGPVRFATRLLRLFTPDIRFRELYQLENSRVVRAAVRMPLCYLGGVQSLDAAQQLMGEGFDAIALGRALLHDPALIEGFRTGRIQRSGCTACNECVVSMYTPGGTRCVLRPPNDAALNRMPAASAA